MSSFAAWLRAVVMGMPVTSAQFEGVGVVTDVIEGVSSHGGYVTVCQIVVETEAGLSVTLPPEATYPVREG